MSWCVGWFMVNGGQCCWFHFSRTFESFAFTQARDFNSPYTAEWNEYSRTFFALSRNRTTRWRINWSRYNSRKDSLQKWLHLEKNKCKNKPSTSIKLFYNWHRISRILQTQLALQTNRMLNLERWDYASSVEARKTHTQMHARTHAKQLNVYYVLLLLLQIKWTQWDYIKEQEKKNSLL